MSSKKETTSDENFKNVVPPPSSLIVRRRRAKRDKVGHFQLERNVLPSSSSQVPQRKQQLPKRKKVLSKALQKHADAKHSGGMQALLPSFFGLAILFCGAMAKMGFRGRATVAGVDLGTTNSVICVQAPSKSVGEIQCIPDPATGSTIIPSVVSFLEPSDRLPSSKSKSSKQFESKLFPHPSHVVVGRLAKQRIDSHPHHTLYNAKRVLGRPFDDAAVSNLKSEVEFAIDSHSQQTDQVVFRVPHHLEAATTTHARGGGGAPASTTVSAAATTVLSITPQQVGSYVVHHLMEITKTFLGHDNIKSAVICVPAKFDSHQRRLTIQAFEQVGISVARVLEEPTAAALAYGLHRKPGVDHILVYDFGGGTLDVSLLHVSDGFVDVMGSDGDDRLGGADFDAAVAHYLLEHGRGKEVVHATHEALLSLEQQLLQDDPEQDLEEELALACPKLNNTPLCTVSSFHTLGEQMKIDLSSLQDDPDASVQQECFALVNDSATTSTTPFQKITSLQDFCAKLQPNPMALSLKEYNTLAQPLFERSVLPVRRILADLNLSPDEIDEVVMVGGTTRMPQIRTLVRQEFTTARLNTHIDPDITVAYGAASVID